MTRLPPDGDGRYIAISPHAPNIYQRVLLGKVRLVRVTPHVRSVLRVFLDAPGQHCFGYGIMQDSGLLPGTVYPLLRRLEQAGWVTTCDHGPDPEQEPGRPPRKCYELTPWGVTEARKLLEEKA
jgi:hypothetical protein